MANYIEVTPETKPISDDGFVLTCLRCGWQWIRRTEKTPNACASRKCHSPYWKSHRMVKETKTKNINIFEVIEPATEILTADEIKSKLVILRELVGDGVISEEDYDRKKAKMLGEGMNGMSIKDQLREIKDLKAEGLINEKDYNKKKKVLLDKF